ncbi:hypothetical protein GALMADRAFT_144774 [Galerina marginata CBS 339.88]|uniref:Uncharacterized protein n=1 Tax=Galerina marginata (strain CBS 339.88) TaxID=685588 RepID=A0A067SHZ1_GALM3|nr:hypothetical protein GALMADRAFT_144774 [Galerina marginata CBS 339.88]
MPPHFLSIATQQSDIGSALDSNLLFIFLMGIYTVVYFGTIYLYCKNRFQQRMVVATITALYSLSVLQLGLQWYILKWAFVTNGATRADIFIATLATPGWFDVLVIVCQELIVILADLLLIWRCFFVWNRSLKVILLPAFLLVAEIGVAISQVVTMTGIVNHFTDKGVERSGHIQVALFCISFSSSMAATLLIAFRINAVSNQENPSRRRFRRVIEIVVQSGVVYSLALLMSVACNVRSIDPNNVVYMAYSGYASSLAFILAGLAPTIMVARVCVAPDDNTHLSTLQHVSRIEFQGQSASHEDEQFETDGIGEMQVDAILPSTGKLEKSSA